MINIEICPGWVKVKDGLSYGWARFILEKLCSSHFGINGVKSCSTKVTSSRLKCIIYVFKKSY